MKALIKVAQVSNPGFDISFLIECAIRYGRDNLDDMPFPHAEMRSAIRVTTADT